MKTKKRISDMDWEEDFKHENGNYENICCICKGTFKGNKRRVTCKVCGIADVMTDIEVKDHNERLNHIPKL